MKNNKAVIKKTIPKNTIGYRYIGELFTVKRQSETSSNCYISKSIFFTVSNEHLEFKQNK